jgi:hypothetical protein
MTEELGKKLKGLFAKAKNEFASTTGRSGAFKGSGHRLGGEVRSTGAHYEGADLGRARMLHMLLLLSAAPRRPSDSQSHPSTAPSP